MKRLAALLAVSAGFLAACGGPDAGTVVDHDFIPAHTEYWTTQQCMSYNKDMVCTMSIPIQHSDWVEDEWRVRIKACKSDECDYSWKTVTRETHDRAKTGYFYDSKTGEVRAQ